MRAITLHQPWASAILAEVKPWENRTWAPRALLDGGALWLALHAGQATDRSLSKVVEPATAWTTRRTGWDRLRDLWPSMPGRRPEDYPRGILGLVRFDGAGAIADYPEALGDPWASGPVVWRVGRVIRLRDPIPVKGAQGLWTPPPDVRATLRELLADHHQASRP